LVSIQEQNPDFEGLTDSFKEDLYNLRKDIISGAEEIIDNVEKMYTTISDAMKDFNDEFDDNLSKFDTYTKMLSHYESIIGLIGKDNLGISDSIIEGMRESKVKMSLDKLKSSITVGKTA